MSVCRGARVSAKSSIFLVPSKALLLVLLVMPPMVWLVAWGLNLQLALVISTCGPLLIALGKWIEDQRRLSPTDIGERDALTGLPGRAAFANAIRVSLRSSATQSQVAACIVVDLDDFHGFNDRWGRDAGDELLRICSDRLAVVLRKNDLVCRLEADALAIFLAPSTGLTFDAVLSVVDRVQVALAEPVRIDGIARYVSACMGIAFRKHIDPAAADPGDALMRAAERAMVEARNSGPATYRVFSPDLSAATDASHTLAEDVSRALEAGEIEAWFQPQMCTRDGSISGMEALARWTHPKIGPISPGRFLPAIEAAGRSERLSDVMLSNALKALSVWDAAGIVVPQVGVNFAAQELRSPSLVEKIKWELDRYGLHPDRLAIEILETVICQGGDDLMLRNLSRLRDIGCKIELDDFGTGAAAITSIRRFGISRIKIDRSFITRLDRDPEQLSMCEAIVTLAKQLGIGVLAEGVETISEEACLRQIGCAHIQGFGIARPMPAPDMLAWLISHQNQLEKQRTLFENEAAATSDPDLKSGTQKEVSRKEPSETLDPQKPSGIPTFQSNRARPRRIN